MMIKPDAVERHLVGEILRRAENAGLAVRGLRMMRLDAADAEEFYAVHAERPFYRSLVAYMSSGPMVAAILEGESAIRRWREVMGATDPAEAAPGTIRKDLGLGIEKNSAHGSDGPETAAAEIEFFRRRLDLRP
jgi:nucleoside-diphosphate kinase